MNRIVTIILLLLIPGCIADCQIVVKGVLLDNHKSHHSKDTVVLYGMKVSYHDTFYYLKDQPGNYHTVPSSKLFLLDEKLNYLDKKWFEIEAFDICRRGWDLSKRTDIEKQTLNYLAELKNNNLIYEDIYLEDYLFDLLKRIHPVGLYKGRALFFTIKMLNSEEEKIYAFENGTILISTQMIANASDEKELFEKMVQAVVHVILDHSYQSMDPFSIDTQRQLGIIYNTDLSIKGKQMAKNYMKFYARNHNEAQLFHDNHYFADKIANVVSYTAWQEYYSQHYVKSLLLLNKIISEGFGTEEDYLLKAKLYRILGSGDEAIMEAILSLEVAESLGNQKLVEIYSEKGILLMKINKWNEALEAFKKYRELIMNQPGSGLEMKWCAQMIHKCRQRLKTNSEESSLQE